MTVRPLNKNAKLTAVSAQTAQTVKPPAELLGALMMIVITKPGPALVPTLAAGAIPLTQLEAKGRISGGSRLIHLLI